MAVLTACGGGGGMTASTDASMSSTCDVSNDTCTGDNICVASACVPAFPLAYRITAFLIHVPVGFTHDTDGKPDLQPHVAVGNPDLQDVTPIPDSTNTLDLTLPGPFDLTLMTNTTSLLVGVDDADPSSPMVILDCLDTPATAQMLRSGGDSCANGPATISFKIAPK
ncbi:MAG: hypothetical protein ABI591_23915 [Kofleriaceae bacterium]